MPRSDVFAAMPTVRHAQRGVVLFVSLILLLILTLLGISLARMQTVEERLSQNDFNHQLALQTAEAALEAAYDDDGDGMFINGYATNAPGQAELLAEISPTDSSLAYHANWSNPGVNTITYAGNGAALAVAPAASQPQFVLENLPINVPPGCSAGGGGGYPSNEYVHRITAHAGGGDGTASATVQIIRFGGC
jgi:type IV pilus assembly protein PilX